MSNRKRHSNRSGRRVLRSPGRPPASRRENRRLFWTAIAAGLTSERAAIVAGVSPPVGVRWVNGGMPPTIFAPSSKPLSGRYLSFQEREEIALLLAQGRGVREIARRLGRSASTVSRGLRRNAATRSGDFVYRATTAQWHAGARACRNGAMSSAPMRQSASSVTAIRAANKPHHTRRRRTIAVGAEPTRLCSNGLVLPEFRPPPRPP